MMTPSIALTCLLVLLGLTQLTLGQQAEECGGINSTMVYDDVLSAVEYYTRCSYPTYKLNVSCILSSCPLPRGMCPLTSTSALNKAVAIINECVGQKGLICGLNVSYTEKVQVSFKTLRIIPSSVAKGTIHLNNEPAFTKNLERARFKMVNTSGPIIMSIKANEVISTGTIHGHFTLADGSFLRPLLNAVPAAFDIAGIGHFNVSSTVSIDLTTHPPTIKSLDDHSSVNVDFIKSLIPGALVLPADIANVFNRAMDTFLKKPVIYTVALNFLSTYAALALKGAQEGCP